MKKIYVFLPSGIACIGGAELYILGKKKWLENNGWRVHIFSSDCMPRPYKIAELDSYAYENIPTMSYPPFQCTERAINRTVNKMIDLLCLEEDDEVVIESHTGASSLWGELLAKKIGAKHVLMLINEYFSDVSYSEKIEFFIFKFKRKELYCGFGAFRKLFGCRDDVSEKDVLRAYLQEDPVQDVSDARIESIGDSDYAICYIGRLEKPYVPNIIKGVIDFSKRYSDKSIQLVIVGDNAAVEKEIVSSCSTVPNITIMLMGNMVPIPRDLFNKIDVVVAGSGSARCSALEGVPTIVADPDKHCSNGVLGYDTVSAVWYDGKSPQKDFCTALEDVLVFKYYADKIFNYPPQPTVEECCQQNMRLIAESSQDVNYYSEMEILCGPKTIIKLFRSTFASLFPELYRRTRYFVSSKLVRFPSIKTWINGL